MISARLANCRTKYITNIMSANQNRKAPSSGTKVDLGRNAPVTEEGAGFVAPESLAAESYRGGGEFGENRHGQPDSTSTGASRSSARSGYSENTAASGNGGSAPSYASNQYIRDSNGPHGKDLKEGGFDDSKDKDGLKLALSSEPGSKNDPSRLAEERFELRDAAGPSVSGRKDTELSTATKYDGLDSETTS
ncbi:Protein kinase-like protein [Purpureocillium lavendulum]|uniref:Protein kinase-like protein n=1 Tax=Purpureocillium lavendulum TaxID=1247861 RepID=A0AB34FFA9_9HYPO|nr:Protein kinase-like protein [Purpureocillium lavendulum]